MKVFWETPQKTLQLEAESADDLNLISDLLIDSTLKTAIQLRLPEAEVPFECSPQDGMTYVTTKPPTKVVGMVIDVDPNSPQELRAKASSQALSALRQVFRLGLGDSADDLVARLARFEGNLQPQEQLTAALKHLQSMLEALSLVVSKQEAVINALVRAHSDAPVRVEGGIVAQGGAA